MSRRTPTPADLNVLGDAELNTTLAHCAGIVASRHGDYEAATMLRRIADALLAAPKRERAA